MKSSTRCDGTQTCITVLRWHGRSPGYEGLVAYVVAKPATRPTAADVLRHVQATLPIYMVPSACVFLKTLPLTPNGKVDRRALPSPESTRFQIEEDYRAPKSDTERRLAAAWETVLGRRPIGTRDNFFHHGGDSLLAVRLIREIEENVRPSCRWRRCTRRRRSNSSLPILGRHAASTSLLIPIQPVGSNPRSSGSMVSSAMRCCHSTSVRNNRCTESCTRVTMVGGPAIQPWRRWRTTTARRSSNSTTRTVPPRRLLLWSRRRARDRSTASEERRGRRSRGVARSGQFRTRADVRGRHLTYRRPVQAQESYLHRIRRHFDTLKSLRRTEMLEYRRVGGEEGNHRYSLRPQG